MKRLITLIMVLVLCVGLASCSDEPHNHEATSTHTDEVATTPSISDNSTDIPDTSTSETSEITIPAPPETTVPETTVEIIESVTEPITEPTTEPSTTPTTEPTTEPPKPHVHSFDTVTEDTPATCTKDGQKVETCSCGARKVTTYGALGHDYKLSSTKEPTCKDEGEVTYKCSRCGDLYKAKIDKTNNHKFVEKKTDATCTQTGNIVKTCFICGYSEKKEIAALGHDYKTTKSEATCEQGGSIIKVCSRCNDKKETTSPALGHDWGEWKVVKKATCVNSGTKERACKRKGCTKKDSETIPATGQHSYTSKVTTNPTCTTPGVKTYTCSVCKYSYTEEIAATGHSWGPWTTVTAATCTAPGKESHTCSKCGVSETRDITAKGHAWSNWVTTKSPTCTTAGQQKHACGRCGQAEAQAIPALNHNWKNATCTAPKTCQRCGATSGSALGHQWDSGTVTTQPTQNNEGVRTFHCQREGCNETKTESIPKLQACSHTWVRYVITQEDSDRARAAHDAGKKSFSMPWGEVLIEREVAGDMSCYKYARIVNNPEWAIYYCSKCHEVNWMTNEYGKSQKKAAEEMLGWVNELRSSLNKPPLELSEYMCAWAEYRAKQLINDYSHNGATTAENISAGHYTVREAFESWCDSPGHYNNMIGYYTCFGFGYAEKPLPGDRWFVHSLFTVQVFQ